MQVSSCGHVYRWSGLERSARGMSRLGVGVHIWKSFRPDGTCVRPMVPVAQLIADTFGAGGEKVTGEAGLQLGVVGDMWGRRPCLADVVHLPHSQEGLAWPAKGHHPAAVWQARAALLEHLLRQRCPGDVGTGAWSHVAFRIDTWPGV